MNNKRFNPGRLTLLAILIAFLALTACVNTEQIDEEVATLEAAVQPVDTEEPTLEATEIPPALDPAVVQGMAEFTSATEQFRLRYPADWVAEEDVEGGVLVIANTEAALARFNAGQIEAGDFALNIGFIPASGEGIVARVERSKRAVWRAGDTRRHLLCRCSLSPGR